MRRRAADPDAGTVRVAGLDPVADRQEVTHLLGAQLQESELQPKLTVREALELYSAFYRHPADRDALAGRLGLDGHLDRRFLGCPAARSSASSSRSP